MMDINTEDTRIGTVLNERYRIIERIAAGGMAVVYRGERVELGRPVAIKFLQETMLQYPKFIGRFEAEARAMSKLSHPYCVSVIDYGVDGAPYIVMDYVEGRTLKAVINSEAITPTRAITLIRQILAGIAHAHSQGIIHRDIKPENVILQESVGVGETVRIFDFGLAKLTNDAAAAHSLSMSSIVAGTPNYMSPEQSRGSKVDERTDIYSICVVLFELLTGQKPFVNEDFIEVVRMHRETPPPTLNDIMGEGNYSQELEAVVQKALAKSPNDRFQTAEEFTAALDETPEGFRAKEAEMAIQPDPRGKTLPIGAKTPFRSTGEVTQRVVPAGQKNPLPIGFFGILTAALAVAVITIVIVVQQTNEAPPQKTVVHVTSEKQTPSTASPKKDTPQKSSKNSPTSQHAGEQATPLPTDKEEAVVETVVETPTAPIPQDTELAADTGGGASEPEVTSIADAKRLIKAGEKERALTGLKRLRREQPKNAQIVLMIADLFYEKIWWSDALDYYAEAIRLNPSLKKKATVQKNVIATLSSDKTANKASYVLRQVIGKTALPMLRRAAKKDDSWAVRKRADALVKKISGR